MNKLLPLLVVCIIVLIFVTACFSAGATINFNQLENSLTIPKQNSGMGTITGTVTNQNGNPISFVRVSAFGDKSDGEREYGFAITHLLIDGKGIFEMQVDSGRYIFVRAAKLPLYIGAWAGPVYVNDGETVTIDLSITYIGPKIVRLSHPDSSSIITLKILKKFNLFQQL